MNSAAEDELFESENFEASDLDYPFDDPKENEKPTEESSEFAENDKFCKGNE